MISRSKHQKGFGLAVSLLLVGTVTAVLAGFFSSQSGQVLRREAEVSGWEGAKIARAARIYSRNEIVARPNLSTELSFALGSTGPEEITVADLVAEDLLPTGFDGVNALGQNIRIFIANYPIDGDPTLSTTVPTAYVLFEDTGQTDARLMQDVVASLRTQDVSVSAPVFNGPVNLTGNCNGGEQTVAFWDSGCLSENDYDLLIDGLDNDDLFVQGSFIIPAWRSVSFDNRAMLRFPQPEQTDVQTMLTDLQMANMNDCDANNDGILDQNFVTIPAPNGTTSDTVLCSAISDDATVGAEIDNRRSIIGVNNITNAVGVIVNSQAGNDVSIDNAGNVTTIADEANAIDITGTFNGTGDALVYGDTVINSELIVDKNISVISDDSAPFLPAIANIGILNANNSSSTNLSVANRPDLSTNIAVSGTTENINQLNVSTEMTSQTISGIGSMPVATVAGNVSAKNLEPTSTIIDGTKDAQPLFNYSYVAGQIQAPRIDLAGDLNVDNGGTVNTFGNTIAQNIDVTDGVGGARCIGDCPLRKLTADCTNSWVLRGFSSLQDCINDG